MVDEEFERALRDSDAVLVFEEHHRVGNLAVRWAVWAIAVGLLVLAFGYALGTTERDRRINELERQACAWTFFEDGSAAPETNDDLRYACLADR